MTEALPTAMARGTLRQGFRTSAEMNEMLCQESAEKSEPDWATHNATTKPRTPLAATPNDGSYPPSVKKWEKLARIATGLPPSSMPAAMSAAKAAILVVVNRF